MPEREEMWRTWVPEAFPGLHVVRIATQIPVGMARQLRLGIASLWAIVAACQTLRHAGISPYDDDAMVVVGFYREGKARLTQRGRVCELQGGDICIFDGSIAFELECFGIGSVTLLELPRRVAAARFPHLLRHGAHRMSAEVAEVALLSSFVNSLVENSAGLKKASAAPILESLLLMLASLPMESDVRALEWRVRAALGDIEQRLKDPGFSALAIAQRLKISRRRLDMLFTEYLGTTVVAQIRERRLVESATRLCDPHQRTASITSIAGDAGFASAAHFSRRFKQRFGASPRIWRRINKESGHDDVSGQSSRRHCDGDSHR